MGLTKVAMGLLLIAMFINLIVASRNAAKGAAFVIYYFPPNARWVKGMSGFLFIISGLATLLYLFNVLSRQVWIVVVIGWFFFDNWTSVFYRLAKKRTQR